MYLQPPKWRRFQIWQTHMYGTGKIDGDAPAEIFNFRPMPCIPAGDFVGEVKTGSEAIRMVEYLNAKDASFDEAKAYVDAHNVGGKGPTGGGTPEDGPA